MPRQTISRIYKVGRILSNRTIGGAASDSFLFFFFLLLLDKDKKQKKETRENGTGKSDGFLDDEIRPGRGGPVICLL